MMAVAKDCRRAVGGFRGSHCVCSVGFPPKSHTLLIAACCDTVDLFQIMIHSYMELSSRERMAGQGGCQVGLANTKST